MSDMNAPPPPRGILKNRDGNSRFQGVPEMAPGDPRQNSSRLMNPSPSGESAWMNSVGGGGSVGLGAMVPGSNPVPPVLLPGGLERNFRQKLNDFISRKNDILFKPLTPDEMPFAEVKGAQHNSEGNHYGVVPSLDHFLRVSASEIRRYFFQNLQVGDILIASVHSKGNAGINLKLMSTDGGKHVVLEDLGIKSFCPASHIIPPSGDKNDDYQVGDYVRVEALEVQVESEKLVCGMKGVTLSPEMQHSFHLGMISRHEFPRQFTLAKADSESRNRRSYLEMLTGSSGFQNPNNISHLAYSMGILSNRNSLMIGLRSEFPSKEGAQHLRRIQNGKWAHGNVADGIKFFKMGKFTEAFQCLNKALSIDVENVEGLVARGALYANNGGFEKAIEDFEAALKYNPSHYNARKYLAETLVAFGKQQETAGKLEDAVASYSKCLVVKSDHKESKDALWSLFDRTNKLDLSKLPGPSAQKAIELRDKLKIILQTELGMSVDGKNGKDKKSKRKKGKKSSGSEDDSSSSSTSESDSDSSSSDDSDKGKKKKKSKKKKRKSKKSKKVRDELKTNRALSLSPFSKRLIDPQGQGASGSGLAGFSESSFAEWGQQLGIGQAKALDKKEESDEETRRKKSKDKKRAKKKEKRKRKKRGSSSSSSDSDDSSKEKRKSKSANTSIGGTMISDLGDLEAKLSAYYSKIEQEKIGPVIPPEAFKITVERSSEYNQLNRDAYNEPMRKIEVKTSHEVTHGHGAWHDAKSSSKISLRTDDYGNFIQPENLMRTVHNDQLPMEMEAPVSQPKPIKFEIKKALQPENDSGGSKWRPLGTAPPEGDKSPPKPAIKNPFELQKFDKGKEQDRNYRGRKSLSPPSRSNRRRRRSNSRSRSGSSSSSSSRSRSRSRSPGQRRERPYGRGRGDYYRGDYHRGDYHRGGDRGGRGRGRGYDNRDNRDYRDRRDTRDFRDRDGRDSRDDGGGRGGVRFFRGFNRGVTRRPYVPRGGRHGYRPNGPRDSKFRNRFSRSMSRSRSGSRSRRSTSKSVLSRSGSKSKEENWDLEGSFEKEKKNEPPSDEKQNDSLIADSEMQIGELTTTKASDVEELLDKRNAEKKEELRKSNPEFFRSS